VSEGTDDITLELIAPATIELDLDQSAVGPPGPPGPSSTFSYVHEQGFASSVWTIVHDLDCYPIPLVQDTANDEIEGAVNFVSLNEMTITFSAAVAGTCYLN
jgi:hypothetical protein